MSAFPVISSETIEPPLASFSELLEVGGPRSIDDLNRLLQPGLDERPLRFAAQTPNLLADGLHYEERIAQHGVIATRENAPHDWFNALVWLRHMHLKRAMNARQVADIARVGRKQRTRGQCALTHFDEAGAVVWLGSPEAIAAWDAHDWKDLFRVRRADWGARIAITVVGHALYEYAFVHKTMPVAKALAVVVNPMEIRARCAVASTIPCWPEAERSIAARIASGRVLADPQELRPLPLAGIPEWHAGAQSGDFFETMACFQPLRPGRRYPAPIALCEGLAVESERTTA